MLLDYQERQQKEKIKKVHVGLMTKLVEFKYFMTHMSDDQDVKRLKTLAAEINPT